MAATLTDSVGLKGKNNAADVRTIQALMDRTPTGAISVELIAAIKLFQQSQAGLTGKSVDGKIDPGGLTLRTLIKIDFDRCGVASPSVLTDADIEAGAKLLNLEVALVKTVADVETMGSGFLPSGRPRILFEHSHFSKMTSHKYDATHASISNSSDVYGGDQYKRLFEAMACDREAALLAASWGRFQIMGENYQLAGFTSVEDFVDAMRESEQRHFTAFLNYVKNNGSCLSYLKNKKWTAFAEKYNGKKEATKNKRGAYHTLLEDAYNEIVRREQVQNAEKIGQLLEALPQLGLGPSNPSMNPSFSGAR